MSTSEAMAALSPRRADVAAAVDAACKRWPDLELDPAAVLTALAECGHGADAVELPRFAADLVLAHACLRGDARALRYLERELLGRAARVLHRLRLDPADIDDVLQEVRARLLVGPPPRLAQYQGDGPLEQWLASVAGRGGLALLRRRKVAVPVDDDAFLDDDADPELALLQARHGADVKRAFQAAIADLPPRDRAVLRALVVDEIGINDVAALYRIHRVTASRWVAAVRRTVLAETRRRLGATLHLEGLALDSAVRLVSDHMDLSLYRILDR